MPTTSDDDRIETLLAETGRMRRLAAAVLRGTDESGAEDVVQDASAALLTSETPRGVALSRWLRRIVRHLAIDRLRRRDRRDARERVAARHEAQPATDETVHRLARHRAVVAAVEQLPPASRDVVLRRFFDDLKPRAIAAELGVPVATVKSRLQRAIAQLRERLRSEWGGEFGVALLALTRGGDGLAPATAVGGTAAAGTTGVLLMSLKAKLAIAAAALLLAGATAARLASSARPNRNGEPEVAASPAVIESSTARSTVTSESRPNDAIVPARVEQLAPPARPRRERLDAKRLADLRGRVIDVRGAGVGGAEVEIVRTLQSEIASGLQHASGESLGERHQTRSDADGRFRFDDLVRGANFSVRARAEGGFAGATQRARAGQADDLEVMLHAMGTLAGVVIDAESRQPVAGAQVRASHQLIDASALTDALGRFDVEALAGVVLIVNALDNEGRSSVPQQLKLEHRRRLETTLVVGREGPRQTIEGVVVAEENRSPIADADVQSHGITVRSAEDGSFRLSMKLPPGSAALDATIRAPGRVTESTRIWAQSAPSVRAVVRLRRACAAIGRVVAADGSPVADAAVWTRPGEFVAMTGADGCFRLERLDPALEHHVLFVRHDECQRLRMPLAKLPAGLEVVDLGDVHVGFGALVSGRVVDEEGAPVPGARVQFVSESRPKKDAKTEDDASSDELARKKVEDFFGTGGIVADREGRFDFAGVPKGRWRLLASGNGFVRSAKRTIDVPEHGVLADVELVFPAGLAVAGRVVDSQGRAVEGASVQLHTDSKMNAPPVGGTYEKSGADGRFRIAGLDAGVYVLSVEPSAAASSPTFLPVFLAGVDAGKSDIEVVLPDGAVIEGDVFDESGVPVSHFKYKVLDADGKVLAQGPTFLSARLHCIVPPDLDLRIEVDSAGRKAIVERARGGDPPLRITLPPR